MLKYMYFKFKKKKLFKRPQYSKKDVVLYLLPSKLKSSSREKILNTTWGKKNN